MEGTSNVAKLHSEGDSGLMLIGWDTPTCTQGTVHEKKLMALQKKRIKKKEKEKACVRVVPSLAVTAEGKKTSSILVFPRVRSRVTQK